MSDRSWSDLLAEEKQQPYFQEVMQRVQMERDQGKVIYPPPEQVFNAFKLTPLAQLKVVILGQDPYHGPGQAHGLCFSVPKGVAAPPSLKNIFKALQHDYPAYEIPEHGDLTHWAEQGVLLLNTVLTVEQGQAGSHAKWGWERFTDKVIEQVNAHCEGIVFLLWGAHAQKKGALIDRQRHHVLTAVHPSPLSAHRGFLTCGHFRRTNELLEQPIHW
ncbi:uracil-DNA glycosylase [Pseudidiomarina sp. 1APP75-32.1]|uniref:Uracil-DNA glycosylase n=1 Tax=Pseudidiomarina terrestris TaxID=2820060 RepID=A0AAW7QZG6_9GAMM|nr:MULTISPECIES: uracil-DNA glycosylase [unclassified Pseudidiomarina]MDN7124419.1 uracil-DNA glycosylase [Pseudidiomarina sp. 1APP75-32.1]MDN7127025.1 uracil-DNA glycosylase [Pseudidiomarina sp. 1APR75-33.1]MDN7129290.1 uracil-DNA glycosylase [Pseudidiomarina sp. 1APR75-15]MDN7136867.1 uracil-DNA glycosylase [Pseudidiomarina sp. 1ASP75-14]MEA3587761.1 uracil-DNA glycosylase [Pseudidiomarina sp. 1APP75-27a]